MREIWQKLDRETDKAYRAFRLFLEGKSMEEIAKEVNTTAGTAYDWMNKHRWTDRRNAYHAYLAKVAEEEKIKKIEEVCMRHAKQVEQLQLLLMLPAKALAEKLKANPELVFKELTDLDALSLLGAVGKFAPLFKPLVQTERLALGMSTENISEQDVVNISIVPAEIEKEEEGDKIEHTDKGDTNLLPES